MQIQSNSNLNDEVEQLKQFIITTPGSWTSEAETLRRMELSNGEVISCILWDSVFYITGTDIIKCLAFRFEATGRVVTNMKKFEEGVFSDLRNLKVGLDAKLEPPRSKFLDYLYKLNCVRTQKKQKVFFWFSVPHDRLFSDALERDLKREEKGLESASTLKSDAYQLGMNSSEIPLAHSFAYNSSMSSFGSGQVFTPMSTSGSFHQSMPSPNIVDNMMMSPIMDNNFNQWKSADQYSHHNLQINLDVSPNQNNIGYPSPNSGAMLDSKPDLSCMLSNYTADNELAAMTPIHQRQKEIPISPKPSVKLPVRSASVAPMSSSPTFIQGSPNYKTRRRASTLFRTSSALSNSSAGSHSFAPYKLMTNMRRGTMPSISSPYTELLESFSQDNFTGGLYQQPSMMKQSVSLSLNDVENSPTFTNNITPLSPMQNMLSAGNSRPVKESQALNRAIYKNASLTKSGILRDLWAMSDLDLSAEQMSPVESHSSRPQLHDGNFDAETKNDFASLMSHTFTPRAL